MDNLSKFSKSWRMLSMLGSDVSNPLLDDEDEVYPVVENPVGVRSGMSQRGSSTRGGESIVEEHLPKEDSFFGYGAFSGSGVSSAVIDANDDTFDDVAGRWRPRPGSAWQPGRRRRWGHPRRQGPGVDRSGTDRPGCRPERGPGPGPAAVPDGAGAPAALRPPIRVAHAPRRLRDRPGAAERGRHGPALRLHPGVLRPGPPRLGVLRLGLPRRPDQRQLYLRAVGGALPGRWLSSAAPATVRWRAASAVPAITAGAVVAVLQT